MLLHFRYTLDTSPAVAGFYFWPDTLALCMEHLHSQNEGRVWVAGRVLLYRVDGELQRPPGVQPTCMCVHCVRIAGSVLPVPCLEVLPLCT